MTTRAPITDAHLRRLIRAATKEGLRVTGIAPDGTILVDRDDKAHAVPSVPEDDKTPWDEVEV